MDNRKRQALFLDRDGVINVDTGYPYRIDQINFIDGIFEFCGAARSLGLDLVVVTNQAGIGRGYYTEADFQNLMSWMSAKFEAQGVPLKAVYHCPYHPEGEGHYKRLSSLRKPEPGMLVLAGQEHGIELPASYMIGDRETDAQAGRAAGLAGTILFRQGRQGKAERTTADFVAEDFPTAAYWLRERMQAR